jgi:hypothetical protein
MAFPDFGRRSSFARGSPRPPASSPQFDPFPLHTVRSRHPYMFLRSHIPYLSFYAGWVPAFSQLCSAIDAVLGDDKREFHWRFAEERNGGARYGYNIDGQRVVIPDEIVSHPDFFDEPGPDDREAHQIYRLVKDARDATERQCIVCGTRARLSGLKGVVAPLCAAHMDDRVIENLWDDTGMSFYDSHWMTPDS